MAFAITGDINAEIAKILYKASYFATDIYNMQPSSLSLTYFASYLNIISLCVSFSLH